MKRLNFFNKLVIIISITATILSGCSDRNKSVANQNTKRNFNQTPINWIGNWQSRESKKNLVNSAVREFEFLHQDIKVNIKYQEDFCGGCKDASVTIQDTIANMIMNNNFKWDIIPLTQKYYSEIGKKIGDDDWGKKYLVDFGSFEWFRKSHIEQVFEVAQYRDDFGGIYAGPLIEGRNSGMWYNTETAKKLGIEIKNMGMTYDDFLGYCKKTYQYNQTNSDKITFFSARKLNVQIVDVFNNLVLSELGPLHDQLPDKNEAVAAIRKSLQAFEELSKNNPIDPTIYPNVDFIGSLEGKVLFTVQPSSWYNQCESENGEMALNLVPAELPVYEKSGDFYKGSYQSVWAVFKNAPHRDQAIELMKYISSNDVAERWLSTTYNPTGLKVKLKASDFGQNEIEKFNAYIERKYGKNLKNFDLGMILFGRKVSLDPTEVFKGEMTAEEFYRKNVSQF